MRVPEPLLTAEEYAQLPDDDNYRDELSRGRVVREPRPSDTHGATVVELIYHLRKYLDQHPQIGELRTESGFRLFSNPDTVRGPDVAFISARRLPEGIAGFFQGAPDIAIEVVSPSNTAAELQEKVIEYLAAGTQVVWVIYPESQTALQHLSDGTARIIRKSDPLTSALLPGFSLQLADILHGGKHDTP